MRRLLPRSLSGQLVLALLTPMVAVALVLPTVMYTLLNDTADDFLRQRLAQDTSTIAHMIAQAPPSAPGTAARVAEALGPFYDTRRPARAFVVSDAQGRTLVDGGIAGGISFLERRHPAPGFRHGKTLDIFTAAGSLDGRPIRIAVAQDRTQPEVIVDDIVAAFLRRGALIGAALVIASISVAVLLILRLTDVLRRLARDAARIGPDALDMRLTTQNVPREVQVLAEATNQALDRMEAAYRRQHAFAASVAHELRTPLALLGMRCEALPPSRERTGIAEALDRASHVVDQLMELATLDGRPPPIGPVDLARVARDAVEANAPLVFRSNRKIQFCEGDLAPLAVQGNEGLLRLAITNLIDNAIRHTPPGTAIVVATAEDGLFVCDDGPGMPAERIAGAPRGGDSRAAESPGLGLRIVERIMQATGGTMIILPDMPGTVVRLRLRRWKGAARHSAPFHLRHDDALELPQAVG